MIGLRASPSSTSIVCRDHPHHKSHPHLHPIAIHPSIHSSIDHHHHYHRSSPLRASMAPDRLSTVYTGIHPFGHSEKKRMNEKKTHLYVNLPHNAGDHKVRFFFFFAPRPFFLSVLSCLSCKEYKKCHKVA